MDQKMQKCKKIKIFGCFLFNAAEQMQEDILSDFHLSKIMWKIVTSEKLSRAGIFLNNLYSNLSKNGKEMSI